MKIIDTHIVGEATTYPPSSPNKTYSLAKVHRGRDDNSREIYVMEFDYGKGTRYKQITRTEFDSLKDNLKEILK